MGYFLLVVWIEAAEPEEQEHPENVDFYILEAPSFFHAIFLDDMFSQHPPKEFVRRNIRTTEVRQIGNWSEAYPPIEEVPIIPFDAAKFKAKMIGALREDGIEDPEAEFEELFGPEMEGDEGGDFTQNV